MQLINVPGNEEKYKEVKVSGLGLAALLQTAGQARKPAIALLNGLVELVFSKEELIKSSGQGLRGNKENALNPEKLAAMKG